MISAIRSDRVLLESKKASEKANYALWFFMEESQFVDLVRRIRDSLGCSKDLAADYARGIGETPEIVHGRIIVRDHVTKRIIAYVPQSIWVW